MADNDDVKQLAQAVSKQHNDADIILYSGDINHKGSRAVTEITRTVLNKTVVLLLCTNGGFPGEAYKIARRLQSKYEKFIVYVYGYCKSAGTLVAIGSDEIIMSDTAEFGPLDVQTNDGEEIGRLSSGLNVFESLRALKVEYDSFFKEMLIDYIRSGKLSTKTAASISAQLAQGLFQPILANIDPLRIGELGRAMKIGIQYGSELSNQKRGNIEHDELVSLVTEYPDHGYVIDIHQAKRLFKRVREETELEHTLGVFLESYLRYPYEAKTGDMPKVSKLFFKEVQNATDKGTTDAGGNPSKTKGAAKVKRNALPPSKQAANADGVRKRNRKSS